MTQSEESNRFGVRVLILCALFGCTGQPTPDAALDSLRGKDFSSQYHSAFWTEEAQKKTPLWAKAQEHCRVPENAQAPNCRVVVAVDLTVRILPVYQDENIDDRLKEWIRRGAEDIRSLKKTPEKGFRELPKLPEPPRR